VNKSRPKVPSEIDDETPEAIVFATALPDPASAALDPQQQRDVANVRIWRANFRSAAAATLSELKKYEQLASTVEQTKAHPMLGPVTAPQIQAIKKSLARLRAAHHRNVGLRKEFDSLGEDPRGQAEWIRDPSHTPARFIFWNDCAHP
jgi:hypothetical protein